MPDVISKYYVIIEVIGGASAIECKDEKGCNALFGKLSKDLEDDTLKHIRIENSIFVKEKITRIYKTKMEKKYTFKPK